MSLKDSQDLANKIKNLIDNKDLYEKISKNARQAILNKFDEKKVVKYLIEKLYP